MALIVKWTQIGWERFIAPAYEEYTKIFTGDTWEVSFRGYVFRDLQCVANALEIGALYPDEAKGLNNDDVVMIVRGDDKPPYARVIRETDWNDWDR